MLGQKSVRSLHSLNSLTRSISGDIILTAVGAAASSSVESSNNSSGNSNTNHHHHHRSPPIRSIRPFTGNNKPPRRLGSSSVSSSCSSGRPGAGTDRIVSLPREQLDRRSRGGTSNSDEETRLSGFYGLMSLSHDSSMSRQSSMSSVTTATHFVSAAATTPTTTTAPPAAAATHPPQPTFHPIDLSNGAHAAVLRAALLDHHHQQQAIKQPATATRVESNRVLSNTAMTLHQDIQVGPMIRASWTPPPPPATSPSTSFANPNIIHQNRHHPTRDDDFVSRRHASTGTCPSPVRHRYRPSTSAPGTTRPSPTTTNMMIEIAPGVSLPLRGAEETQQAIAAGFYVQCECWACPTSTEQTQQQQQQQQLHSLYCILDCDYFLCPDCRSVAPNPLKLDVSGEDDACQNNTRGGLGLGFRLPELQER